MQNTISPETMHHNTIIHSDNLEALKKIPAETIDLVYCDPPFMTGRDFTEYSDNPDTQRSENISFERRAFQWMEGILSPKQKNYFSVIIPRILEIHRILKPTGALYWHCDHKTSHYIKIILDQVFGQPQFRNEIVWTYNSTAIYDNARHIWKNNLDNIFFYAKPEHQFEGQHTPLNHKEIKTKYRYVDSNGRRYRHKKDGDTPSLYNIREYADEDKGSRIPTAWTDINIAPARERTGYPTQKPMKLLKRIIRGSSKKGEVVLDPYCGSGTTCMAAKQLGRIFIGIDTNDEAVYIAKKRLGID